MLLPFLGTGGLSLKNTWNQFLFFSGCIQDYFPFTTISTSVSSLLKQLSHPPKIKVFLKCHKNSQKFPKISLETSKCQKTERTQKLVEIILHVEIDKIKIGPNIRFETVLLGLMVFCFFGPLVVFLVLCFFYLFSPLESDYLTCPVFSSLNVTFMV